MRKWLGILVIGSIAISLFIQLLPYLMTIGAFILVIALVVKWKDKRKKGVEVKKVNKALQAKQNTIEYKMERLLNIAGYPDKNGSKRQQYLHKDELNLRDYWYKYIDLRAKLSLNNTSTHREEEVLKLMADELLYRLDNAEVEVTDIVRKQFVEENLTPLLHDVVDILDGIHPTQTININAYELLKTARAEREPIQLNIR